LSVTSRFQKYIAQTSYPVLGEFQHPLPFAKILCDSPVGNQMKNEKKLPDSHPSE